MAKQKRDAKATRAKIIKESRTLFSVKGYDATTVDDIAQVSGVNKALIYYYFKNKSGLYSEVMSGLFDAIYSEVTVAKEECSSIVDELQTFIQTYANYAYKNPYFPALLLRELSDSGAHLPEMMFASMRKLFVLLSDILKRGEEQKVFVKSIPIVIHFMITGTLNLMITTMPLRKELVSLDSSVNVCNECSAEDVSSFIFETVKKSLEVER